MGKVKSWRLDCAEEQSDDIIKSYVNGEISRDKIIDLSNVENIDLCGIDEHNVEEVLDDALSELMLTKKAFYNNE